MNFLQPGCAVFVAEDEALIAMLLEDLLAELGCSVAGTAASVPEGLQRIPRAAFAVAIVDLNLQGQPAWPLADLLKSRGTPFVMVTGYGRTDVQSRYPGVPVVSKPFELETLRQALSFALGG